MYVSGENIRIRLAVVCATCLQFLISASGELLLKESACVGNSFSDILKVGELFSPKHPLKYSTSPCRK